MGDQVDGDGRQAAELLELVAAIARAMAEAPGLAGTTQAIVDLAERSLDDCDGASLMLVARRRIETPASSSEIALEGDRAQLEADEGPCLDAIREHDTFSINDLETDQRWPRYRDRAFELGIRAQIGFRLFMTGDTIGSLNLYSRSKDAFDPWAVSVGHVFATHASIAMKAALVEAGLETALHSRDVIGQAKGIMMARRHLTADMAFDALRELSQHSNTPLREVAARIAETGELS